MLTPCQNPQFLSRAFTDLSGRQFRLTFFVTLVNGEVRGRLVSAERISEAAPRKPHLGSRTSETILCLPISCHCNIPETAYTPAYAPVASPYYSAFEFLIHSQPTRAPSRA